MVMAIVMVMHMAMVMYMAMVMVIYMVMYMVIYPFVGYGKLYYNRVLTTNFKTFITLQEFGPGLDLSPE